MALVCILVSLGKAVSQATETRRSASMSKVVFTEAPKSTRSMNNRLVSSLFSWADLNEFDLDSVVISLENDVASITFLNGVSISVESAHMTSGWNRCVITLATLVVPNEDKDVIVKFSRNGSSMYDITSLLRVVKAEAPKDLCKHGNSLDIFREAVEY